MMLCIRVLLYLINLNKIRWYRKEEQFTVLTNLRIKGEKGRVEMERTFFDDGTAGVDVLLGDGTAPGAVALGAEGAPVDSMRIAEV
jgi:hypothetical protein